MSLQTLRAALISICEDGLVSEDQSIVWHAGEPLALPISYYEEAFDVIADIVPPGIRIHHSFQTNGVLLTQEWCNFIKERHVSVGVSIDGPAIIHDAQRVRRNGQGTHASVMRGVELLHSNNIPFSVIAVLTTRSLHRAKEIFDFFRSIEANNVGFNIEELEGVHEFSSLTDCSNDEMYGFWLEMFALEKANHPAFSIREFEKARTAILGQTNYNEHPSGNDQTTPLRILSIDFQGNISTFSPELLGMSHPEYDKFTFGNVLNNSILDILEDRAFQTILHDIKKGVSLCQQTCPYFSLCGGGAPSNKLYENGNFSSAETMFCRFSIKMPLSIVLADLEASAGLRGLS